MSIIVKGIDVGSGNTKGNNCIFSSGVEKFSVKPPVSNNCICWGGNYYEVGLSKMDIQENKFADDKYRILTMAALARDLRDEGIYQGKIRLGVGVPLTRMGIEAKAYKKYMLEHPKLDFTYEDEHYFFEIISVDVFPQGFAGVADRLDDFTGTSVIVDIGSWTIDIMPVQDGNPNLHGCKSLNMGTIPCMNEINEKLRQTIGKEAGDGDIKTVMIHGTSDAPKEYLDIISAGTKRYAENIINRLVTFGFNMDLTKFVFIGGGATIMKHFGPKHKNMQIIEDVNINARGYENLIRCMYEIEE